LLNKAKIYPLHKKIFIDEKEIIAKLEKSKSAGIINTPTSKTILFDYNKYNIKTKHINMLIDLIMMDDESKNIRFEITGHTDNSGSDHYNKNLSKKRVKTIEAYLLNNGIPSRRIITKWKGEKSPINNNSNETEKAKNRRVEIKLTELK